MEEVEAYTTLGSAPVAGGSRRRSSRRRTGKRRTGRRRRSRGGGDVKKQLTFGGKRRKSRSRSARRKK